jgi:hypothetical protein
MYGSADEFVDLLEILPGRFVTITATLMVVRRAPVKFRRL